MSDNGLNTIRTFDGQKFKLVHTTKSKEVALSAKEDLVSKWYKVRVIPSRRGNKIIYAIYARTR